MTRTSAFPFISICFEPSVQAKDSLKYFAFGAVCRRCFEDGTYELDMHLLGFLPTPCSQGITGHSCVWSGMSSRVYRKREIGNYCRLCVKSDGFWRSPLVDVCLLLLTTFHCLVSRANCGMRVRSRTISFLLSFRQAGGEGAGSSKTMFANTAV